MLQLLCRYSNLFYKTELKKLNELLELGIITQEEYVKKAEKLKKVILD